MQGFNMGRYVPPDLEGVASFNQASGTKAQKPTVRFEMPFAIWCTTCPKPTIIGQGVRFNAIKQKVGSYFSTPIFSFTIKHTPCSGTIEIRTDPKNTAYVVTSGAKKREYAEDELKEGEVRIGARTTEEKLRLESDPFARLESKVEDRTVAAGEKKRIEQLYRTNERDWGDPGAANAKARKGFRLERKGRQKMAEDTEALQERMGIGMELLEENDGDRRQADLVEFGKLEEQDRAKHRPLFERIGKTSVSANGKRLNAAEVAAQQKEKLTRELEQNTRVIMDPFLGSTVQSKKDRETSLKRKRTETSTLSKPQQYAHVTDARPLVDYDSD